VPRPERAPPGGILPLRLENLVVELAGTRALSGVSVELSAGPCSVIVGPNGGGKSTLLRVYHGLVPASSGRVRWCGPAAAEAPRRQAMVLQRPVLLRRRVAANVAYPLRVRGVPADARRARVAAILEQAKLLPLARRAARSLSVGEQQRVALARAWAVEPEVLWLDEPASALDPGATRALEETIRRIRASGTKIAMTTHDLGQARRLADEILLLHHGQLLERTPSDEFFERPRSEEGRAFLKGELLA